MMKALKSLPLIGWCLLLLLPWPETAAAREPDHDPSSNARLANALQAHLQFLADDLLAGRDTGSPEYEIAARYVAAQLGQLGLQPAGDNGSFLQAVPLAESRLDVASARFLIERDGDTVALEWAEDFLTRGDPVRTETEVTAPVVFAGFGISAPELSYDDYAAIDVAGQIVLLLSGAPASFPHNQRAYYSSIRTKIEGAVARGAVGVLFLRTAEDEQRLPWERIQRHFEGSPSMSWLSDTGQASDYHPEIRGGAMLSRGGGEKLLRGTGRSLEEVLTAASVGAPEAFKLPVRVTLGRTMSHDRITSSNVVALLPGADPELRDETVVYTAHLDHVGRGKPQEGDEIYNGAYDNAMGVSVLLEIARLFAAADDPPRRSILFAAVTGEEKGLLGSDYLAHHPVVDRGEIVANVNLDMPLFLYPVADVVAFGAEHSTLEGVVSRAAEAVGLTLSPDPMPEEVLFIRSDQYSFVRRGVPSVFMVSGRISSDPAIDPEAVLKDFLRNHYHMPSDDQTRPVDWPSAARFVRLNYLIGQEVANSAERPAWNDGDFFGERFGTRQRPAP